MRSTLLWLRLLVVNYSPAVKRLFWWQPELYFLLSVVALIAVVRLSFNKYRLVMAVLSLGWVATLVDPERALFIYLPALIVWTFLATCPYSEVERHFWRLRYVFLIAVVYAVVQKAFGYFPHEIGWITSGIGAVREEGYFLTEEVRSFSFFAGVPEFGFFSAVMLFLSIQRKHIPIALISVFGIYLAGSRGVMLSTAIALSTLLFYRARRPRVTAGIGVVLAVIAYLLLAIVLPLTGFLEAKDDSSRLLVYGTFGYRVTMLLELVTEMNLANVWYGIGSSRQLFDNFYLTLLNDFGIIAVFALFAWFFRRIRDKGGVYFAVLILSYCLYADALFSIYFLFNGLLLLNATPATYKSTVSNER